MTCLLFSKLAIQQDPSSGVEAERSHCEGEARSNPVANVGRGPECRAVLRTARNDYWIALPPFDAAQGRLSGRSR